MRGSSAGSTSVNACFSHKRRGIISNVLSKSQHAAASNMKGTVRAAVVPWAMSAFVLPNLRWPLQAQQLPRVRASPSLSQGFHSSFQQVSNTCREQDEHDGPCQSRGGQFAVRCSIPTPRCSTTSPGLSDLTARWLGMQSLLSCDRPEASIC